jgi:hypothetical protein
MTDNWGKIERVRHGIVQQDQFDGAGVKQGTMFFVRFPNGETMTLPAIVRRRGIVEAKRPFVEVEEVVYFAVPYKGLEQLWMRAIDVEVQPVDGFAQSKKK